MRIIVTMLAAAATEVLGIGVFGLPSRPFCLSLVPLSLVAGWMTYYKEKR